MHQTSLPCPVLSPRAARPRLVDLLRLAERCDLQRHAERLREEQAVESQRRALGADGVLRTGCG